MNSTVDQYLSEGCGRCKYGGTPQCKVHLWQEELKLLRKIALDSPLTEEVKWGVPVYTHHGKNVLTINALKASANMGFFKGVLLSDQENLLQQQGNMQSDRIIRFTNTEQILNAEKTLKAYVLEAVSLEDKGMKVRYKQDLEPLPDELLQAFIADPLFEAAFNALTPGKRRGYILYFAAASQSKTRIGRIAQYKQQICDGVGLHDRYQR